MAKTDRSLGEKVREYLIEKGVEIPIRKDKYYLEDEAKLKLIGNHFQGIMTTLGLNLEDIVTGKQIGRASCRERVSSPV